MSELAGLPRTPCQVVRGQQSATQRYCPAGVALKPDSEESHSSQKFRYCAVLTSYLQCLCHHLSTSLFLNFSNLLHAQEQSIFSAAYSKARCVLQISLQFTCMMRFTAGLRVLNLFVSSIPRVGPPATRYSRGGFK